MVAIGYSFTWKGFFGEATAKVFSTVVTNLALPAYMIWNLTSTFDKEKMLSLEDGLIIPFISMIACYAIGYIISKLIKVSSSRRGIFRCMFFVSNTIFIGLPVNVALFGDKSVPYVLLYYVVNTCLFWTVGVYNIGADGDEEQGKLWSFQSLQKTISPPLMGFFIGVLLILLEIKLPFFITNTCKYLGNLTTPLSMLFIGISIYGLKIKDIKPSKDIAAIVFGRFVVSPLLVFLIAILIPVPTLMKEVFIIQAAMPVVTNASIIARAYNADYRYAAVMTTVTTVLAMIAIPIYMILFSYI